MLFFLPIMLFGNAQFVTDYAQNYAHYASKFCKRVYITIIIEQEMTIEFHKKQEMTILSFTRTMQC